MNNVTSLTEAIKPRRGHYKGKLYPSGDFTVGLHTVPKTDNGEHPLQGITTTENWYGKVSHNVPNRDLPNTLTSDPTELFRQAEYVYKLSQLFSANGDHVKGAELAHRAESIASDAGDWMMYGVKPMGLSDVNICHKTKKTRKKRSAKGITAKGRRLVKSALATLEKKHGRKSLSLLTVTLPAMSQATMDLVCKQWSEITRQFCQALKRRLEASGYPSDYVVVTELQEKRWESWRQLAPHLHIVFAGRKWWDYALGKDDVRDLWQKILLNITGELFYCTSATRIEVPRKSLKAELGKYMSKGCSIAKEVIERGMGDLLPKSWYRISDGLRRETKSAIRQLSGDDCEAFVDKLEELKEAGLVAYKPLQIEYLGRKITIGFVGWIRDIAVVSEYLGWSNTANNLAISVA